MQIVVFQVNEVPLYCVLRRDFRSPDDIEEDDKQDSDYEPEPLIHAKEPKKKRGRGKIDL